MLSRKLRFLIRASAAAAAFGGGASHAQNDVTQLDEISVQGQGVDAGERADGPVRGFVATRSATGAKTDLPLKETPQSISVVTQDQIQAIGAQTPTEALRYTAGVQADRYGGDPRYDWLKIRGFDSPEYLDGLQLPKGIYAWPRYETYGIERLEVLKGPASVLYGQSPPGGLVNFVSKKPLDVAQNEVVLTLGNRDRIQGAFDVTGPANAEGTVLYRMVGLGRLSDTIVDHVENDRAFFAPSVTFKPSESTSLTVLAHYIRDDSKALQFLPEAGTLKSIKGYGKLPRSLFIGVDGYDDFEREEWGVGYEFEHRFENNVTFRQKARYTSVDINLPVVRGGFAPSLDETKINRIAVRFDDTAKGLTVDNQLAYELQTGAISHNFLVGFDYRDFDLDYVANTGQYAAYDILNPQPDAPITGLRTTTSNKQTLRQAGFYAQDQIKFDRFVMLLSGRYDDVTNKTSNRLPPTASSPAKVNAKDSEFTYRAGLLYNFDNGVSPYVSYSTMFQPASGFSAASGSIGTGVDADGRPFKPTTGDQIEAGVKYQPPGTRSLFTAAVYDITQKNVTVAALTGSIQEQVGEVRMKGFEAEAKLGFDNGWDAVAAFTYSDSEIAKAVQPTVKGNRFPTTPKYQASGFVTYTFQTGALEGFGLGGGVRYYGSHYGDQANLLKIPSYTLFDATARYDLAKVSSRLEGVHATVTATNVFDKKYVASCVDRVSGCYWGNARTVIGTLAYRW